MAHFAKLDKNNVVIAVLAGRDEDIEEELFARTGDVYRKTSYNTREGIHYGPDGLPDGGIALRYTYAGIGMTYDPIEDKFSPPQ